MPYGSGPRLSVGEGSSATTRPTVPSGPWASSIKKGLIGLPMQLGSHVSKARTHVPKVPDVRAIIDLQDVWTGGVINACKTCGHVVTVQRQPC
jgi:hypothetical protein